MMSLEEISALLGLIAGIDRKMFQPEVTRTDLLTWHATIGDLGFVEARAAVWQHYADSTEWLMPAHIKRIAKTNRQVARRIEQPALREIDAAEQVATSMPEHIRELLVERWGPPEKWKGRESLSRWPRSKQVQADSADMERWADVAPRVLDMANQASDDTHPHPS